MSAPGGEPGAWSGVSPLGVSLNMPKVRTTQIANAMRARTFVRFKSRFEDAPVRGYVVDVGPKFFLVALVSDRIWFDGFECFRVEDVREFRPDPYAVFAESALKKRGEQVPKKPSVSVARIEELLLSARRDFPLVTIQREQVDPDVCSIGRILGVERGRVSLLEITPAAMWEEIPESYRLSEITRVSFGADYEAALHLVGGDPKQANQSCERTPDERASRGSGRTIRRLSTRRWAVATQHTEPG